MADGQGNILTISTRERFKYENTLVCLLQALSGRKTTVELRNETAVEGKIVHVDGFMNTEMSRVVVTNRFGKRQSFDRFHIHGKRIRFVHIPSDVDISKAIEAQMASLHRRRHHVDKQSKIGTRKNLKAEEKMKAGMKRADGANAGVVAGATVGGVAGTTTRAAAAVAATEKGNKSTERENTSASEKAKTSIKSGKIKTEKGKGPD